MNRLSLSLMALLAIAACHRHPAVPILGYHAVVDAPGKLDVTPQLFAAQLDALVAAGFHTVSLRAVLDHEDRGSPLPSLPLVLTFDDGTADAITTVLPMLRVRGLTATFFVVSGWLAFDEAHRQSEPLEPGEPSRPVLTWPELRLLHDAGMEIGSHSRTHARLPSLSPHDALAEMAGSKHDLDQGLGSPVELFAYPYNSVRARTEDLLQAAGYRAAVAGQEHGTDSREALYRIGVYRETNPAELVRFALAGKR